MVIEVEKVKAYYPEEARQILRLGREAMYSVLRSGQIRSRRVGRRYIISAAAIREFLDGVGDDPSGDGLSEVPS